jgi:hypothetical protein
LRDSLSQNSQKAARENASVLRRAVEEEVKRREIEGLKEEISKLKPTLDKIRIEDIVASVREDRDRR